MHGIIVDLTKQPYTVGIRYEIRPVNVDPLVIDLTTLSNLIRQGLIRHFGRILGAQAFGH